MKDILTLVILFVAALYLLVYGSTDGFRAVGLFGVIVAFVTMTVLHSMPRK